MKRRAPIACPIACSVLLFTLVFCSLASAQSNDALPDTFDVELLVEGNVSGSKTYKYKIGSDEFVLTVHHVYLVLGNASLLAKGEPPPGYKAASGTLDPLQLGTHSLDGYVVADLVAPTSLGVIQAPAGVVGPLYLAATNADASTAPLIPAPAEVEDAMLVLTGRLVVGELLDKELVFTLTGERLFVLAAPAFELSQNHSLRISIDIEGWFDDVDFSKLTHSTNVIRLSETANVTAFAAVSAKAEEALDGLSWSID
ncbi:MAG: hypothetical protein RBU37_02485 [Myxococcota bacterium]|jgi:hypothetical protein|nr:hypothetical protein [Myxococcota bacterium]